MCFDGSCCRAVPDRPTFIRLNPFSAQRKTLSATSTFVENRTKPSTPFLCGKNGSANQPHSTQAAGPKRMNGPRSHLHAQPHVLQMKQPGNIFLTATIYLCLGRSVPRPTAAAAAAAALAARSLFLTRALAPESHVHVCARRRTGPHAWRAPVAIIISIILCPRPQCTKPRAHLASVGVQSTESGDPGDSNGFLSSVDSTLPLGTRMGEGAKFRTAT